MHQLKLLDYADLGQVVNVASVPQRSPFRYPGGKTWLVPKIRTWLDSLKPKPVLLIEPFAGGGIVGLTAAFEKLTDRVIMVELDEQIASVWKTIINGEAEWLANRILNFKMTRELLIETLTENGGTTGEIAFRTILKNRTNHGGIMAPGAGLIKNGESGKGIASRWYPQTLAKRIREIGKIRDRLDFLQGDGLEIMSYYQSNPDVAFFIDPPYTAAGKKAGQRLYFHNVLDHEALFSLAGSLQGKFLMTYDNAEGVREIAIKHNFQIEEIAMKNTHHAKMDELLISKDLSWLF